MPTTFVGFKDHPIYLLERHLLSDEVIHPTKKKAMVAIFKGEPVYLQSFKEKLRTKSQWRKELRVVFSDAIPVKTMKRQVRKRLPFSESEADKDTFSSIELNLFGFWQTADYHVSIIESPIRQR